MLVVARSLRMGIFSCHVRSCPRLSLRPHKDVASPLQVRYDSITIQYNTIKYPPRT